MKPFTNEKIYICKGCYAELIEDEIVKYNKKKERDEEMRLAEEAKAQQSIPDFIDIANKDEEDDLPF